jgi:hypothetical protein
VSDGETVAIVAGCGVLVIVGYFLYQQQEDTQFLLMKSVAGGGQKGVAQEFVDVGTTIAKGAAALFSFL